MAHYARNAQMSKGMHPNDIRRFKGEQGIPLKNVPSLPGLFLSKPNYERVRRWVRKGIWMPDRKKRVKLRARREGREIMTSVEAVVEFQAILNGEVQ
jgi:hypothetical protein